VNKVRELSELKHFVHPGDTLALGGAWLCNKPMAAVRQILRDDIGDLHALTVVGGLEIDLLIAARLVSRLTFSFVSLDAFGLAPAFRRAIENQEIAVSEASGLALILGLEAQGRGVPFLPYRGPFGSDYLSMRPDFYQTVTCPFTGEELVAVAAIQPDVAIIHAQRADRRGNAQVLGTSGVDPDLARAARRVVVTTERLVPEEEIRDSHRATNIQGLFVDAVIEAPFGAYPTSSYPDYVLDGLHFLDYVAASASPESLAEYLDTCRRPEEEFRRAFGGERREQILRAMVSRAQVIAA
jgi:glutaconate CoA-transferase subunit A